MLRTIRIKKDTVFILPKATYCGIVHAKKKKKKKNTDFDMFLSGDKVYIADSAVHLGVLRNTKDLWM